MEKARTIGPGLEIKTLKGRSGRAYLVFRTGEGQFHFFSEVSAKEAAVDCGADETSSDETSWNRIWHGLDVG